MLGRQVRATDPDTGTTQSSYDDAGRLTSTTTANGDTLAYAYDVLDRKTEEHKDSVTGALLANWTYDALADGTDVKGQPVASTGHVDGGTYTSEVTGYDVDDRPTSTRTTITARPGSGAGQAAASGSWNTTVVYNPDGSIKNQTLPAVGGLPAEQVNYTYTEAGNLGRMSGRSQYVRSITYNEINLPTEVTHASGLTYLDDRYTYANGTNRLTESSAITSASTNNVAADRTYTYTDAGTITKISDAASSGPDTQCFTYDYAQRLSDAWTPASDDCATEPSTASLGGPAPYWQTYAYDVVGDRTSITRHATAPGGADATDTYHYTAPSADRPHAVTSIDSHSTDPGVADHTDTYGYDADGNTTTRPGQALTWDGHNRLTSTQVAGGTQTNIYDAGGNLIVRLDPDGSATAYLGDTELHTTASGTATATRTYTALGHAVAVRFSYPGFAYGRVADLSTDPQGTAQVSFDTYLLKYTSRRFDPFGDPRDASAVAWPDQHGFLDKPTNTATGTTHLGARDYDSTLGRFLSIDPVLDPADPQSLNGYAYANNNPTTKTDPSGLKLADCNPGDCGGGPINGDVQNGGSPYHSGGSEGSSGGGGSSGSGGSSTSQTKAAFVAFYTAVQSDMRAQLAAYVRAKYEGSDPILSPQLKQWMHYMSTCGGDIGDCYVAFQIGLGAHLSEFQADQMGQSICSGAGIRTYCGSRLANMAGEVRPDSIGQLVQDTVVTPGIGGILKAFTAGAAETGMESVRVAGQAGESAAGILKNTNRIPSVSGTRPYRIPDELNSSTLGEVKNVTRLSYTRQLHDFQAYAQSTGRSFNLYVRGTTKLSGPLQDAIDVGEINLIRNLPG